MASFFKKLFGKIEKVSENVNTYPILIIDESFTESVQEEPTNENIDLFFNKEIEESTIGIIPESNLINATASFLKEDDKLNKPYSISEINKQSTLIKNKDGYLSAIAYISSFIESNEIDFSDLISLLKRQLSFMKKEKSLSDVYILDYINSHPLCY
jgi:intergrase/recombinase